MADLVQAAVQLSRTRLQTILGDEDTTARASRHRPCPSSTRRPRCAGTRCVVWQARQLAAERAEMAAEEEARFARTREQWWADAENSGPAGLPSCDRHARELMAAEDRCNARTERPLLPTPSGARG